MKDSGVEWIGEVPEHWEILLVKRLSILSTGSTPPTDDRSNYSDQEIFPWIRPEDLDESGSPARSSKFLSAKGWESIRKINPPTILICCIGTIGKIGYATTTISTNQQITSAQFKGNSRFYYYTTLSAKKELEIASTGNVLKILNTERLGNIIFPSPPLSEQIAIATFLDRETTKIDTLIAEATKAITLLQERRFALISAAVTGKIDVRHLVSKEAL